MFEAGAFHTHEQHIPVQHIIPTLWGIKQYQMEAHFHTNGQHIPVQHIITTLWGLTKWNFLKTISIPPQWAF
jgi:hypothetical protein